MQQLFALVGNVAASLGLLLCAVSGLARASGLYYLAGYQNTTLFMVGTGLLVVACLAKLEVLTAQSRDS